MAQSNLLSSFLEYKVVKNVFLLHLLNPPLERFVVALGLCLCIEISSAFCASTHIED